MKIIKKGKVVPFKCQSCEGKFVAGIHSAKESDGNYYACCPMCGNECHASAVDIQEYEKETKQNEKQPNGTHEKHGAK